MPASTVFTHTAMMTRLALFVLTSCTIATSSGVRDPRVDHHLVPAEALDHQNPAADTSHNPIISSDVEANHQGPAAWNWHGGKYDALAAIGYVLLAPLAGAIP